MKTTLNILGKGLAGLTFIALLAVNVQIGTDSNILFKTNKNIGVAGCPGNATCYWVKFPGDDHWTPADGDPVVVTPEEN